ncbi:ATP-binding cassette domain-containing protein [Rhizobium sp. NFR07]|uniref:phosphonate ABC transporter ATP-binding protein n=1 Tax=Rhizobium sp. NFR07 TaxID=1566262 RepID=UPI000B837623|nr:ATP-binding cassette domain-containing protein [Rhizobium sp. NFR07]
MVNTAKRDGDTGSMGETLSLSCYDVFKSYSAKGGLVLHGVSLEIDEGDSVALIGANGSGKSTLLKSLVGLHPVDKGKVRVLGRELQDGRLEQDVRRQIGFVFQNHGLVQRLSALSNVIHGRLGFPGSWRAWHQSIAPEHWRQEALEALEAVGLGHRAAARADQLSGGQAQRVAIARALVRKPKLMIADEPAASLDPKTGMDVMETFASIAARSGTTLIYTTHDMAHALRFAKRIVALKSGRVALDVASANLTEQELQRFFHEA